MRPAILHIAVLCALSAALLLGGCGVAEFLGFGEEEKPVKKHKEIKIEKSYLAEPDTEIIPTRRTMNSAEFRAVRVKRTSVTDVPKRREIFEILNWAKLCGVPAHPSSQLPSVTRYDLSNERKFVATIWAYELEGRGGFKYWVKTPKEGYLEYDPESPKSKAVRLERGIRPASKRPGLVKKTEYTHIEHHGEAFEYISNANLAFNWGKEGGIVPGHLGDGVQIYLKEKLYGTVWIDRQTVFFQPPDNRVFVYNMKESARTPDEVEPGE
ncbi:MAG: hypothetical protein ACYS8W_02155 [Planctomycetota bacterium]